MNKSKLWYRSGLLILDSDDNLVADCRLQEQSIDHRGNYGVSGITNRVEMIINAANACQAGNPTHPEKVADQIEAAFKALKLLVTEYDNATKRLKELHVDTLNESPTWVLARQALDAIENKEEK